MNKILIIGSGGREHALAWKLAQSLKVEKIYIAPGNAGTAQVGENVDIKATDLQQLVDFALKNKIDLTVVGPDDPLALGIVDVFAGKNLKIWGPTKNSAQIESSKAFAKELMIRKNIPTAEYKVFTKYEEALNYLELQGPPIVVKASGLALGKGVTVCKTIVEAQAAVKAALIDKVFGEAGSQVILEEFLEGPEISIHAFSDGQTFALLPPAQDHKPIFDGDQGPNTGGMGSVAPLPWVNQDTINSVINRVVKPAFDGLKELDANFAGLLYPGLILTSQGPKVLEFNARFGDPECQSYMRLLKTDLFDVLQACVEEKLSELNIEWNPGYACCIVLASEGYPGKYEKGFEITGLKEAEKMDDVVVFHAGTTTFPQPSPHDLSASSRSSRAESRDEGRVAGGREGLITNGGRVLAVSATGDTLKNALNKAYSAVKLIHFEGMHYRTDIGQKSLSSPPLP